MRQQAIIKDSSDGKVSCELLKQQSCSGCSSNQGCAAMLPPLLTRWRASILRITTEENFNIGQRVWVELDDALFRKIQANAYGLPLFGMVLGAGMAAMVTQDMPRSFVDAVVLVGAIAGLSFGAWQARIRAQRFVRLLECGSEVLGGRLRVRLADE